MVKLFAECFVNAVIRIDKRKPVSACDLNARISGTAQTLVLLVNDPDAAVLCCRRIAQGRAAVRGAVVY